MVLILSKKYFIVGATGHNDIRNISSLKEKELHGPECEQESQEQEAKVKSDAQRSLVRIPEEKEKSTKTTTQKDRKEVTIYSVYYVNFELNFELIVFAFPITSAIIRAAPIVVLASWESLVSSMLNLVN